MLSAKTSAETQRYSTRTRDVEFAYVVSEVTHAKNSISDDTQGNKLDVINLLTATSLTATQGYRVKFRLGVPFVV